MKKILFVVLAIFLLAGLLGCNNAPAGETGGHSAIMSHTATEADIKQLEALYEGRQPYHGELHDHANTGGTSDGKVDLDVWRMMMSGKDIDFATIVDHKQVLHMRLDSWDNALFIGGTEAGTTVLDSKAEQKMFHYNMIFATPEGLENVLNAFSEKYQYLNDHFVYPNFRVAEMEEVAKFVTENGGFFVHVHPKGGKYMKSDDPLDYYFGDYTGIEVLCGWYGKMGEMQNQKAYKLWTDLLALGKKVYATSGSDSHNTSNTVSLTTIYSEKQDAATYLGHVKRGDFTAGPVGLRMCVGDTTTGGTTAFAGKRLVVSAGDFHSSVFVPGNTYRLDLYSDTALVASKEIAADQMGYLAIDADENAKFYRAVLYNATGEYEVAVGNPIWNEG